MLDVGQGLSVLVQADGKYLLYDGGGRGTSSYVVAYLQQHDVTKLEWLAASHYDEDHISGLVGVLHTTPVEQALMPDYTTDTQIYQSLQTVLGEKNVPVIYPAKEIPSLSAVQKSRLWGRKIMPMIRTTTNPSVCAFVTGISNAF